MPNQKRILFIVHALKSGGVGAVLNALSDDFVKSGHSVTIATLSKDRTDKERADQIVSKNITLYQCKINTKNPLQLLVAPIFLIPLFIKHRHFDLIIIPGVVNAIAVIPIIKAMLIRAAIVVNAHTAFSAYYKTIGRFKKSILAIGHRILPIADVIANDSIGAADDLAKHYGLVKVDVLYNPVATPTDLGFSESIENAPHLWLKDSNLNVFVSCGRLVKSKNYAHMIRVFSRLIITDQSHRLILIGTGTEEEALKSLADELNISEFISFEGFVDDPKRYFYHADYFWLSSKFEGFSIVLGEALTMGTPCITNDCPFGPAEVIEQGEYGLLLEDYNEAVNAAKIIESLKQPSKSKDFYRSRAKDFLVSKIAQQYIDIIDNRSD